MHIWRRSASSQWSSKNRSALESIAQNRIVLIERVNRKRLLIEVATKSRAELRQLVSQFGGRVDKLPADWLKRFQQRQKTRPITVGRSKLIIPAGRAFGTGEHATTAMCLRLLERVIKVWGAHMSSHTVFGTAAEKRSQSSRSRGRDRQHATRVRSPDLVIDLGTGSGILALAARGLGTKRAIGIDNDPIAISTAKENARRNKIQKVKFQVADLRRCRLPRADIITANLFSELLINILPKLKKSRWLILSGILREQEAEVVGAIRRNKYDLVERRYRGKWTSILAKTEFAHPGRGS